MVVGTADPRIAAATERRFQRLPCISGIWAVADSDIDLVYGDAIARRGELARKRHR
jgi:hypothetical protein